MITEIADLPDHIAGFVGAGYVTGLDYETVLVPTVEDKLQRHHKIDLLYHLADDFIGFETGALWDDAKVGLGHRSDWNRVAIVCDLLWMRHAVKVAGFLITGEVRLFDNQHYPQALAWVRVAPVVNC